MNDMDDMDDMDQPNPPERHRDRDRDRDGDLTRVRDQRTRLQLRHAQRLAGLMETRHDLRGVHALADYFDDAVRWSA